MDYENLPPVIREQIPLNQALAAALIAAIPADWQAAGVRLTWPSPETPMTVEIGGENQVFPGPMPDQLREAAANFDAFRAKYRLPFQAVVLELRASAEHGWQMKLGFE